MNLDTAAKRDPGVMDKDGVAVLVLRKLEDVHV